MINATANEILNSLIGSKKCQLMEARHKLSMYSDLVARLESEISALENASEIIIGDSDVKKSIIHEHDPGESVTDCFKEEYADGEEGMNNMLEDARRIIRHIFNNSYRGENVIGNIFTIAGGDDLKQLKLLDSLIIMSAPIVFEDGQEIRISHEELVASSPIRRTAIDIIYDLIEMSAGRIRKMQSMIDNLTEALAISTKDKSDVL